MRTAGTMAPIGGFRGKGEHHGMAGEDDQWKLNPKSKLYNCSSDWEKLLKFKAEGQKFANFLRSLELGFRNMQEKIEKYISGMKLYVKYTFKW